jgi:hypothetical protein
MLKWQKVTYFLKCTKTGNKILKFLQFLNEIFVSVLTPAEMDYAIVLQMHKKDIGNIQTRTEG